MTTRLKVRYDGRVLVPQEPVDLPQGRLLEVELQPIDDGNERTGLSKLADELAKLPSDPNSPTDMAAQHDHYLYGKPKRDDP